MPKPTVLALVLAGGEGSRLELLTERRAKPALPFAGDGELKDFGHGLLPRLVEAGEAVEGSARLREALLSPGTVVGGPGGRFGGEEATD